MKELKLKLAKLVPNDKLNHFFYGSLIANAITMIPRIRLWDAMILMTILAIAIEVRDYTLPKGRFSVLDVIFTIAPMVFILIRSYIR